MENENTEMISAIRRKVGLVICLTTFFLFLLLDCGYFAYNYFVLKADLETSLINIIPLSICLFVAWIVVFILSISLTKMIIKPILKAEKDKEQYIGRIKNNIKTPINNIKENALTLKSTNEKNRWVQNILNEANNMYLIVEDIGNPNPVEHKMIQEEQPEEIIKEEFDLSNLVEQISASYDAICFNNHVEFVKNIEPKIMLSSDKKDVSTLTKILIENAIKNVDFNGIIQVALFKDNGNTYFSVYNSGCKIKEENKEQVYEAFYSKVGTHPSSVTTNVNLETLKTIIEQNKFTLYLDSKESTFFKISVKF